MHYCVHQIRDYVMQHTEWRTHAHATHIYTQTRRQTQHGPYQSKFTCNATRKEASAGEFPENVPESNSSRNYSQQITIFGVAGVKLTSHGEDWGDSFQKCTLFRVQTPFCSITWRGNPSRFQRCKSAPACKGLHFRLDRLIWANQSVASYAAKRSVASINKLQIVPS